MEKISDQLARISQADREKPRKNIVIIGSGMAGLSAAYELSMLGHEVSIIEASNRVGGRVWTHRFNGTGEYHELGAMRIPESHDYTRHYIQVVGLSDDLRPFISSHKNKKCFYYLRGKICRIEDAPASVLNEYSLSTQEQKIASTRVAPAILGMHFENTLKSLDAEDRESMFGGRFLTDRVAELERQSLGEYFERRLESRDALELIGATTGLEVWWHKSISMFIRDEIVNTGDGLEEIGGGTDRLPNGLADKLGREHIRFNTEVVAIELLDTGVLLRTRQTDSSKWDSPPTDAAVAEEKADIVICTIPFGVLRRMEVKGLSALKMRAIRNLSYASSTKVLLHCKERFWELDSESDGGIIGGASMTDQITRATYYPSDHAQARPLGFAKATGREGFRGLFSNFSLESVQTNTLKALESPGPGVLVGSYNWGRDARRLGALSVDERGEAVMNVLKNFHPKIRDYVDEPVASMYWDDYRWSRGAFCFMQPGDLRNYYHAAIRSEGQLHFAGEHCSLDQGWMQGAIISGLRVVEEIVNIK